MIYIEELEKTIAVDNEKFEDLARQTGSRCFLHIVSYNKGYVLVGAYGVLMDDNGSLEFQDLSVLHALIRSWGFEYFFQDGQLRYF